MKSVIFGAGSQMRLCLDEIRENREIVAIVDNDASLWSGGGYCGIPIQSPTVIQSLDYDEIILCNLTASITVSWLEQLDKMGVQREKINFKYCVYIEDARNCFLKNFAQTVYEKQMLGSVAEAGVFRGDFAKEINNSFYDRKCYLFDTFKGFHEDDVGAEKRDISELTGRFADTSKELVMEKMPYPENVVIKEGKFPDTAKDINDKFCFVNLDMDLREPTLKGLKLFEKKMIPGGVILVHDYFSRFYTGIKSAVDDWLSDHKYLSLPIGDSMSICILF